nr:Tyrosyl-DNA phosphodiesterase domain containing protein [Haemonchus contortus]
MNMKGNGDHGKSGNSPCGLLSGRMYLTKVAGLSREFNAGTYHLSDILQIIRPQLSLHFNFMIDLEWLIQQYPVPCRDSPIQCVVGEKMGTDKRSLLKDVSSLNLKQVSVLGAPLPIPFGTHHTKLSIFDCEEKLHVIVSTANLIEGDWHEKTQCFYYACGTASAASSIGSLGDKKEAWLFSQFLRSLQGGRESPSARLYLIYPCVEDVRNSLEGYSAGDSLPYQGRMQQQNDSRG